MHRFYVDFNSHEEVDAIVIRLDVALNSHIRDDEMHIGDEVILHDETMECMARLRKGTCSKWLGDIIPGTTRDLPEHGS
jgi:hypothetical protein